MRNQTLVVFIFLSLALLFQNMSVFTQSEAVLNGFGYIDEMSPGISHEALQADLSAPLQSIVTQSVSYKRGFTIKLRPGATYRVLSPVNFKGVSGLRIIGTGEGQNRSRLLLRSFDGHHFRVHDFAGVQFENLIIETEVTQQNVNHFVFDVRRGNDFSIENVSFVNIINGFKLQKLNVFRIHNSEVIEPRGKVGLYHDANPDADVHSIKSDILNITNFKGIKTLNNGIPYTWINANYFVHTMELLDVHLSGGDVGVYSSHSRTNGDPSALFGLFIANSRFENQNVSGIKLSSAKTVLMSRVQVKNSGGPGIALAGFLGSLQFHDLEVTESGEEGVSINASRAEGLYFYNPRITHNSKRLANNFAGVRLRGSIEGLSFTNGILYEVGQTQAQSLRLDQLDIKFFNLVGTSVSPMQSAYPILSSHTLFNLYKPGALNPWKASHAGTTQVSRAVEIKNRILAGINGNSTFVIRSLSTAAENSLQLINRINQLCPSGGSIVVVGKYNIDREIKISRNCGPIRLTGTGATFAYLGSSLSNQYSQIFIRSANGKIKIEGVGHIIENISIASENGMANTLVEIDNASHVLMSHVWTAHAQRALHIKKASQLVIQKSRFSKAHRDSTLYFQLQDGQVAQSVFLFDVSLGGESGGSVTSLKVLGPYEDFNLIAPRAIRGGVGFEFEDLKSLYTWGLQADNTAYNGLYLKNISKSYLIDSWIGQVDSASGVKLDLMSSEGVHFRNLFVRGSRGHGIEVMGQNILMTNALVANNNICAQATPTEIPCDQNFSSVHVGNTSNNIKIYGGALGLGAAGGTQHASRYALLLDNAYQGHQNSNRSEYGLLVEGNVNNIGLYGVDLMFNRLGSTSIPSVGVRLVNCLRH